MKLDGRAVPEIPDVCGIAFKEWDGVCSALAHGRQALILRKGGIDEGPGGFAPEYPAFWLYPTRVHQAQQGLKPDEGSPSTLAGVPEGMVPIDSLASVALVGRVDRKELIPSLDGFHVWTAETVEKRFAYREPGLWVLGVRIYRLAEPVLIEMTPEQAGCKTWVPLGQDIPTRDPVPVLDDGTFDSIMGAIKAALSGPASF